MGFSSAPSHAASPGAQKRAELGAPSLWQPEARVGDARKVNEHFQWGREQNWRRLSERERDRGLTSKQEITHL